MKPRQIMFALHFVRSFEIMKLEDFKDVLTPNQYSKYLKKGSMVLGTLKIRDLHTISI